MVGLSLIFLTFFVPIIAFTGYWLKAIKKAGTRGDRIYAIATLVLGLSQFALLFFV